MTIRATGHLKKIVSGIAVLVLVVFFYRYLSTVDYQKIRSISLNWKWLSVGFGIAVLQRFLYPIVWLWLLRDLNLKIKNLSEYNWVYAKSWMGRYIPGKVGLVATRIYYSKVLGATKSQVAVASALDVMLQLMVAGSIGVLAVGQSAWKLEGLQDFRFVSYAVVVGLAISLVPPVFNRLVKMFYLLLRQESPPNIQFHTIFKGVFGFLMIGVVSGVYLNFICASVDPHFMTIPIYVWGVFNLAGVIGMVFVLAPTGLGVREAVQLPLLSYVVSVETALAIVVLMRFCESMVDLSYFSLSFGMTKWRRRVSG